MNRPYRMFAPSVTLLLLLAPVSSRAQEAAGTVEASPHMFAELLELDGLLVPSASEVLRPEFEKYTGPIEVVESASPGPVVEGQVLFRFKEDSYLEQLKSQRIDFELAKLDFEAKQQDAPRKEEFVQIAFTEAERAFARAQEDFARYEKEDLPRRIREQQLSVQGFRDRISDQQEELAQLERMYGEDDLTEETEEIVLRRTRRGLERSLISLGFREDQHRVFLDVSLPREMEDRKLNLRKAVMTFERATEKRDEELRKLRLEMEKAQLAYDKSAEALEQLEADRARLVIQAPAAGLVVGGLFKGDKWTDVKHDEPILEPGDVVKNKQELCTFLPPQTPRIQVAIEERKLFDVKPGQSAVVVPTVLPKSELIAEVKSVARYGKDKYATTLVLSEAQRELRPGFTCKVKLKLGEAQEGVGVPTTAVLKEQDDRYVFKVDGDAQSKVKVKLGREDDQVTEVVDGLSIGDRILREPPKATGTQ